MEWIQGGSWEILAVEEDSATAYKACLQPVIEPDDFQAGIDVRTGGSSFFSNRERWVRDVGAPANVIVYEPTPNDARELLGRMQRIVARFGSDVLETIRSRQLS